MCYPIYRHNLTLLAMIGSSGSGHCTTRRVRESGSGKDSA